jgi:hypothetical protein
LRSRAFRKGVSWACAVFVFLLFAFPNYCDRCRFQDVARLFAQQQEKAWTPPCCAKTARGDAAGNRGDGAGSHPGSKAGASHARVPYCIGITLASLTEQRDVVAEILLAFAPSPYRPGAPAFARLAPVFDHKDSRGPPA